MGAPISRLAGVVEITGATAAQSQLRGVGKATEEAKGGFKGMIGSAMSFAGAIGIANLASDAFGFLKDQVGKVFAESMNAQLGMAQTNAVLKSTHDISGMTAQAIGDLATKYSHLTMFSDDTVQAASNVLLTFTKIGKGVFPDATLAVLNLSQAMGEDSKTAALQLGKALQDPVGQLGALKREGIDLTDVQKSMIRSMVAAGDTAGAQKIILAELNTEFKDSAVKAGSTFPGQLKILGQSLDDVRQTIGDAMMPVLKNLTSFVTGTVVPGLQNFAAFLASPAFVAFATTVGTDIVGAIKGLITGISTVITIGTNLVNFFKNNQIAADLLMGVLASVTVVALGFAIAAIPALVTGFVAWAVAAGAAAIATLAATWPILAIGAVIALVVAGIILAIQHWGQIAAWLTGVWGAVSGFFVNLWNTVKSAVVNFVTGFLTYLLDLHIRGILAIQSFVGGILGKLGGLLTSGLTWASNFIVGIMNFLLLLPGRAGAAILSMVTSVLGKLGGLEVQGLTWAGNFVSGLFNSLNRLASQARTAMQNAANKILGVLAGMISSAAQAGANIVTAIANGILNTIESAIGNAMGQVGQFISDHLPHSPAKIGPLVTLAAAGANIPGEIAKGMTAGIPKLQSSLNMMLTPVLPSGGLTMPFGGSLAPSAGASPTIVINVQPNDIALDGVRLSRGLLPYVKDALVYNVSGGFGR
jgi:hypothetical protein